MGRPSNLSDAKWDELKKRLIAGEKASALAKEYKVSKSAISVRISKRAETVKKVASQIVEADEALKSLSLPEQAMTLSLVDELKAISQHMASAARFSAASTHRLAGLAHEQVQQIDDAEPETSMKAIQRFGALTKLANEASYIPIGLLAANKDVTKRNLEDEVVTPVKVVIQVEDASVPGRAESEAQ